MAAMLDHSQVRNEASARVECLWADIQKTCLKIQYKVYGYIFFTFKIKAETFWSSVSQVELVHTLSEAFLQFNVMFLNQATHSTACQVDT